MTMCWRETGKCLEKPGDFRIQLKMFLNSQLSKQCNELWPKLCSAIWEEMFCLEMAKGLTKGTKDSYKVTLCGNAIPLTKNRAAWLQKPSGKELLLLKSLSWFIRPWWSWHMYSGSTEQAAECRRAVVRGSSPHVGILGRAQPVHWPISSLFTHALLCSAVLSAYSLLHSRCGSPLRGQQWMKQALL